MSRRGISAGALRHVIEVQQRVDTKDASGDPLVQWVRFAMVRASVEPLLGKEFFASEQREAKVNTRIRLRYLAGLVPQMRIIWDNRWFDIQSVALVNGIKYEMVVMANELVGYPATPTTP